MTLSLCCRKNRLYLVRLMKLLQRCRNSVMRKPSNSLIPRYVALYHLAWGPIQISVDFRPLYSRSTDVVRCSMFKIWDVTANGIDGKCQTDNESAKKDDGYETEEEPEEKDKKEMVSKVQPEADSGVANDVVMTDEEAPGKSKPVTIVIA